jgi:flagellar motor switch protein FliM
MRPYDGTSLMEINPSLVFPILEMLLGGSGQSGAKIDREITEIEQSILDSLLRIILQDLRTAWLAVASVEFSMESMETDPALLQILAPNEAVVSISLEVRIGEIAGVMNLGIPSIIVKMLRQKFDQHWSVRRSQVTEDEHARMLRLLQGAGIRLDARLQGPFVRVETLLDLKEGDVLAFDYPLARPLHFTANGKLKYLGEVVSSGRKRAFQITALAT